MSRVMMVFVLIASGAVAAEPFRQIATPAPEQPETLISGDVTHGGYGGPRIAYGRVAGQDAVFVGGEGGWIINHSIIIGGAGYGLVTEQPAPGVFAQTDNLTFGYGGFMVGYTFFPQKLVHGTLTALVGAGGIGTRAHNGGDTGRISDAVFVLEPTATLELNTVSFSRAGLAMSYRWVRGVDTIGISNSDLSGFYGSFVLKFGKF